MRAIFEEIYARNVWGYGSGAGSLAINNVGYIAFLQNFLSRHGIRSVVDLGCGDWQFSSLVDWAGIDYRGYDVARSVIAKNQRHFSAPSVTFKAIEDHRFELPGADLLIVKDVLQHWSDTAIAGFLPQLSKFRHALLINCVNPSGPTTNKDTQTGGFRCLDLRLPPWNLPATEVFAYRKPMLPFRPWFLKQGWKKSVLLMRSGSR
ncbi:MAG: hypothetical protein DHS20C11_05130 [Lysobacteraceae bacterium]|nr:MAG: hypothetical protein DHS20C11_05130 [Xanthomonadaceae bacterium]